MSGGLDSSVTALILKKYGFKIAGFFLKFWGVEKGGIRMNRCCTPDSERRARMVAKLLKIPFYVINVEKEFKEKIVEYFLRGYKEGITPNPCVICNFEIKFGILVEKLLSLGFDFIATGHYAKSDSFVSVLSRGRVDEVRLYRAKDKEKDQSYFLWMLKEEQLRRSIFPLGDLTREDVKKIASSSPLRFMTQIPKSVELCFINTNTRDFLREHLSEKMGEMRDMQNGFLGTHSGHWFYTIGQRRGLKIRGGPYYIIEKRAKENLLILSSDEKDLYKKDLVCKDINWILPSRITLPTSVQAKIRYRAELASAVIYPQNANELFVSFKKPQRAITAGQSVVFYKKDEVLGGGIIR